LGCELIDLGGAIEEERANGGFVFLKPGVVDQAADVFAVGIEADLKAGDVGTAANDVVGFGALDSVAKHGDSSLNLDGILAGDGDLFTAEFDRAIDDGGHDFAISGGRDGDDVGELEVGCAELGELANEPVGLGEADASLLGAEFLPGEAEGFVSFGIADLLEAGDAGGRALLCKDVEGLFGYHSPKTPLSTAIMHYRSGGDAHSDA
jgi:hypothetical protein